MSASAEADEFLSKELIDLLWNRHEKTVLFPEGPRLNEDDQRIGGMGFPEVCRILAMGLAVGSPSAPTDAS